MYWPNVVADRLITTDISRLQPAEVPGYNIIFDMDSSLNKQLDRPKYFGLLAPAKRND